MSAPTGPVTPPRDGADQGAAPSRIVLTFAGPGAADLGIALENVTPGQLMAAAWWLDQWVRQQVAPQPNRPPGGIVLADRLPPRGAIRQ